MPTNTYVPLGTITLSSTDSEIVFASIPAGYRDLVLVLGGSTNLSGVRGLEIYFNTDQTSTNYTAVYALGYSSGALSVTGTNISPGISNNISSLIYNIMDYSATDKHKTVLTRYNGGAEEAGMLAGRWANTAAINSITLKDSAAQFSLNTGTVVSLYGIAG